MTTIVETTRTPLPWWKEPTKDQWLAWVAAWLGWTLDSFDFTIFLLIMLPIAQEFRSAADGRDVRVHDHAVDAAGRRGLVGLARRSARPPAAVDDLDPRLFAVQLHRRLLADFLVPVPVPRAARLLHGGGMAGRRGLGYGAVADPLARLHERRIAGLVGDRLPAVERRLRPALHLDRLARLPVDRRSAGADGRLCSLFRQRAAGLGREPAAAARRKSRSAGCRCSASSSAA